MPGLFYSNLYSQWESVLQRIQKAGKGLVLVPEKSEIEKLLTGLSPKGLILVIKDAESESEAKEIIQKVANLTK